MDTAHRIDSWANMEKWNFSLNYCLKKKKPNYSIRIDHLPGKSSESGFLLHYIKLQFIVIEIKINWMNWCLANLECQAWRKEKWGGIKFIPKSEMYEVNNTHREHLNSWFNGDNLNDIVIKWLILGLLNDFDLSPEIPCIFKFQQP